MIQISLLKCEVDIGSMRSYSRPAYRIGIFAVIVTIVSVICLVMPAVRAKAALLKIEAESFSSQTGVLTQTCSDAGGGLNIAWLRNGDSATYAARDFGSGATSVSARVASGTSATGFVDVRLDSESGTLLTSIPIKRTGGWQTWRTVSATISKPFSGSHKLVLSFRSSGTVDFLNLNWVQFDLKPAATPSPKPSAPGTPMPTPTASASPSPTAPPGPSATPTTTPSATPVAVQVEAEAFTAQLGVTTQNTSDVGGGQNVGWIGNGDWLQYANVDLASGVRSVSARIASGTTAQGSIEVRVDGTSGPLVAVIPVSGTGGWQTWRTTSQALSAPLSGGKVVALVFRSDAGRDFANLNWIRFSDEEAPSPTGSPTATPTPSPSATTPSASASPTPSPPATVPGPDNTGVPAGTALTEAGVPAANSSGVIVLSSPGAVYDSKVFNGRVEVNATGVTISRSLIRGQVSVASTASLRITDSEITGEFIRPVCDTGSWRDAAKVTGLGMTNVTGLRLNIHHFGKGIMTTGNFTLRDSWIHDFITGNCDAGGANTHTDGVFVWPGSNNVFTGNFIDAADSYRDGQDTRGNMTAAIFLYHGDVEVHANDVFSGNRMSGGSYTVYAGDRLASNVDWTDNVFVRSSSYPNGGIWGPVTGYFRTNGNDWTNNTWADTGDAISR